MPTEMQDDLGVISEFSITCGRIARTSGVPLEVIQRLGESKSDPFWVQLKDSLKRAAEPVEPILGSVATPVGQVQIAGPWVPTDDERKIVSRFVESNCKFWRDVHGIDLQLPDDVFPIFPRLVPGFGRYIVMPKIGLNAIWDGQLKSFKAWKYFDTKPEAFVTENERDAAETGLYVILVRESVEPDDDLCNMSAGMVKKRKLKTETLAERLVHGHQFFFETQQYLDVNDWTICSGSRYSGGGVPSVRWDDAGREVQVGWDGVGGRGPSSGPRAAVTL